MDWGRIAIAAVLALVVAGLMWWRRWLERESALMAATQTTSADAAARKPKGSFVEVKGRIVCAAPLEAELSKERCVWFRAVTEEEVRKPRSNNSSRDTERREISRTERFAEVEIEDASGRVKLVLKDASIEGEDVVDRYESAPASGFSFSIGPVSIGSTVVGHHYRETILKPDTQVYVLGTVGDGGVIGADPEDKNRFLVSNRSEEERTRSNASAAQWLTVVALGLALTAAAVVGWPFVFG